MGRLVERLPKCRRPDLACSVGLLSRRHCDRAAPPRLNGPEGGYGRLLSSGTISGPAVRSRTAGLPGAVVEAAIASASAGNPDATEGSWSSGAQRRAEGLVDVCRWFLAHSGRPATGPASAPRSRSSWAYPTWPATGRATWPTAPPYLPVPVLRLACDCVLHRVVMAGRSTFLDSARPCAR